MRRPLLLATLILILSLLLFACEGGDTTDADIGGPFVGEASRGERLYKGTTIGAGSAPGCVTCHSLEEGITLVGPSHAGLGTRAASAVAGQSAGDYLRESIVNPDAHVTEGFSSGVMYQNYANDLSEQQIADLVAFLMTLR